METNDNYVSSQPDGGYYNEEPAKSGLCVAAFVMGIIGFFVNPLYLVTLVGIVLGIIGINTKPTPSNKKQGVTGIILCIAALVLQFIVDILLTIFTAGIGGVTFFC